MNKIWKGSSEMCGLCNKAHAGSPDIRIPAAAGQKRKTQVHMPAELAEKVVETPPPRCTGVPSHLLAVLALSAYPPRQPRPQRCPSHRSGPHVTPYGS